MANGSPQRSKSEIEADIAAARARLSGGVEDLIDQVHPKRIKERQIENAKAFAQGEFDRAKSEFKDDSGWRTDRLVLIGGSVAGVLAFLLTIRAIVSRSRRGRE